MAFLKKLTLLAFIGSMSCGVAMAQPEAMLALDREGFKEIMRDSALISGAVVTGVQSHGARSGEDFVLRGYLPAAWAGERVCLSVLTINGFYEGGGTYNVPQDWGGGVAVLPFPTRHAATLGESVGDGLSLRITRDACGTPAPGELSLALSNRREADTMSVLVNSFRADAVYLYVGEGETPVLCEAIDSPARTAFDMRCDLPLDGLSGKVPVEVFRMVERKVAPPTGFEIWLPDG